MVYVRNAEIGNRVLLGLNPGREKRMTTKKKKITAAIICIIFIVVTFASLFYIVKEENHKCTGEDCPICACIHQAEQTLKNLGTGATVEFSSNFFVLLEGIITISCIWMIPGTSLVYQKVRLND